ncbi:MAG TPA: BatD family protein [Edaphobacter sp.]|jgi:hypothetical protein|nr:BatD family protein [Edaphobacter sp.]
MMRPLLVAILLALSPLIAEAQAPVVRAHLQPTSNIMVGQPVRLVVSVFVPNYFSGSPEFPEFELENAIVVLPQDRPENSNAQIDGVSYAGITQIYVIYPQQAGDFRLPPVQMTVPYALAPPKSTIAHPSLPALSFHADVPAVAKELPYFLPTRSLTITQRWSRPLKGLRAGDSFERTITVTAAKMQSMLIPPLSLFQPDGVRIYTEQPITHDQKTDRGDFIYGQRVQSAKYLIQKAGDYTLPPIELKWWNLATHRLVTATLPETKFSATANPDYVTELPPPSEPTVDASVEKISLWRRYRSKVRLGFELIVGALAFAVLVWFLRPVYIRLAMWWKKRKISEATYFGTVIHAAQSNDAKQTYAALVRWSSVVWPAVPLQEAVESSGDAALRSEVDRLAEAVYSNRTSTWAGSDLIFRLRKFRSAHGTRLKRLSARSGLIPLNPDSRLSRDITKIGRSFSP